MSQNQSKLDRNNPFLGLRPFSEREQDYFKGRQAEIKDLLRHLKREVLTVLFGVSGLGKTSLLRAGLFPLARASGYFPILIRLSFGENEANGAEQIKAFVSAAIRNENVDAPEPEPGESLWMYFHRVQFWSARNELLTPVLVFDQFEEIFTLGQRSPGVMEFIGELACLIENRIPATEQHALAEADELPFSIEEQNYRVILSLREDFLADLESLQNRIPSLSINRMRLLPMNGEASLQVVSQVPDLIQDDVAEQVVRFVGAEASDTPLTDFEIEPALLSVFCRELNNKRLDRGDEQITVDLLKGSKDQILHDFYEKSVESFSEKVRRFIEEEMLTTTGYRNSVALEDALEHDGVTSEVISDLINDRLVRVEERAGVKRIELTHDLLTREIKNSRDLRRSSEAEHAEAMARKRAEAKAEEIRKRAEIGAIKAQEQLRRSRRVVFMISVLLIASIGLGLFAWQIKGEALKERDKQIRISAQLEETLDELEVTLDKAYEVSEPVMRLQSLLNEGIHPSELEQVSEGIVVAADAAKSFQEGLVIVLLSEADERMQAGKFSEPNEMVALEKYLLVVEIVSQRDDLTGFYEASAGLDEIADHFHDEANTELIAKNYERAQHLASVGLRANLENPSLEMIYEQAVSKLGENQKAIQLNLTSAQKLVQAGHYLLPMNENANYYFEKVLDEEKTNPDAIRGKKELRDLVDKKIKQLRSDKKWTEAGGLSKAAKDEFQSDQRFTDHASYIDGRLTHRAELLAKLEDLLKVQVISLEDIDEAAEIFRKLKAEYPADENVEKQRALWTSSLGSLGKLDLIEAAQKHFPYSPELNDLLQRQRELERLTKLGRGSSELEDLGQLEIVVLPWGKVVEIRDENGKKVEDETIAGPTPRIVSLRQGKYTVVYEKTNDGNKNKISVEVKAQDLKRIPKETGGFDADTYFNISGLYKGSGG